RSSSAGLGQTSASRRRPVAQDVAEPGEASSSAFVVAARQNGRDRLRPGHLGRMKTIAAIALLVPFMALVCMAQYQREFIRLTGFDRAGNLTWINRMCTTQPVYELLEAPSLTSTSWVHLAFVTNQTQISISNALDPASGAAFFRIRWV